MNKDTKDKVIGGLPKETPVQDKNKNSKDKVIGGLPNETPIQDKGEKSKDGEIIVDELDDELDDNFNETKLIIKKLLREKINLTVSDESSDTISIVVEFNDRNAGLIMVATSKTNDDTIEIVGIKFKKEYENLNVLSQSIKTLWLLFKNYNSIIVAPKPESIEFWNKLGFNRISPNYLVSNRGH